MDEDEEKLIKALKKELEMVNSQAEQSEEVKELDEEDRKIFDNLAEIFDKLSEPLKRTFLEQLLGSEKAQELLLKMSKKIELQCKGNICISSDGEIVVDLRNTDCPPEKAKAFLEKLMKNPDVKWKMPKLLEKK